MNLEIALFAAAAALLTGFVYGVLSYRRRDRAAVRAAEEITQRSCREDDHDASRARHTVVPLKPVEPNGVEPDFSEDDIQRAQFGPRGVPGAPDPARMTPQRAKKTPTYIDQGHVS